MLINVDKLIELTKGLIDESNAQLEVGKKLCQIKVRIDCVVKGLLGCIGSCLLGSPTDRIIELPDTVREGTYKFED